MKRVYIETYGCQMNVADSALIEHLLAGAGFVATRELAEATRPSASSAGFESWGG